MSHCHSCGGVIGRDCWNPQECAEITERMSMEARQPDPAPSFTNTAGLEVVAHRMRQLHHEIDGPIAGWQYYEHSVKPSDRHRWEVEPLVTAASAQARIAELEAKLEAADLALAVTKMMVGDQERRAQAAEARADRLAKALGEAHGYLEVLHSATNNATTRSSVWKVIKRVRAALQQETQP